MATLSKAAMEFKSKGATRRGPQNPNRARQPKRTSAMANIMAADAMANRIFKAGPGLKGAKKR